MKELPKRYVLLTTSNFPIGGPGASYLNLFCRGLKSHGQEIDVFLLKGFDFGNYKYDSLKENITEEGVHYTYLSSVQHPKNNFFKILDQILSLFHLTQLLFSLIKNRNTVRVLLYTSSLFFNIPIHLFSKITGIEIYKFVAEIIDISQFNRSLMGRLKRMGYMINFRFLNKLSDKLIVFSFYLKNEFVKMGFDENKIIVQPNLTDFNYWVNFNADIKYHIGYSGAPYKKDGLYDLLGAIKILKDTNLKIILLVVGDVTAGKSLIPGYKDECKKHGIEDQVTFTGLVKLEKVKEYLSECKILAVTRPDTIQTKAGFPTKLGEYFALRKPVLATKFGDMPEYFKDGYDIMMAECNDPSSIANKIKIMLRDDFNLENMAERGYQTALNLLEFNHAMKRMVNFLNK
ncbi:MAG: glycosyltransferase [Prolixibacteraceae bacterium]|nr:glycosyltransferase [Prolixibacteraceae bacterium]